MNITTIKRTILLLDILLIAAVFRLVWINQIPHSINNDELHYLLSTKAFFLTGKDVTQTRSLGDIFLFHYPSGELVQAELPYILEFFTVGMQPFSLLGNVLPNVFFGILLVFVMYLVTKELFKNEWSAFVSAFLAAINPWFLFMSRTSYEVIPATFFFMSAFYVLLKAKKWYILLVFPVLVLAFYAYIATKLIFLPLVLTYILYCYFFVHKKQYVKQYVLLFGLCAALMLFFLFQLHQFPQASRTAEVLTPTADIVSQQVDAIRKTTISSPLLPLFVNKITVFLHIVISNMFAIFSPDYLFLHGDYFFSLFQHGIFYPLDAIFLVIGTVWLYLKRKKIFFLFITLLVIAITPQVLHAQERNTNFTPHIALLVPFFIIIMAVGITRFFTFCKEKHLLSWFIIVCCFYVFSIVNLINVYFFQMPLQNDYFNFPDKIMVEYVALAQKEQLPVSIYTQDVRTKFEEYLFYTNSYNKENAAGIATNLQKQIYTINSVRFLSCNIKTTASQKGVVTIVDKSCNPSQSNKEMPHIIPQLADSGAAYRIFNDKVCSSYTLSNYVSNIHIADFSLEKLSQKTFCEKFIIF